MNLDPWVITILKNGEVLDIDVENVINLDSAIASIQNYKPYELMGYRQVSKRKGWF